MSSNSKLPKKHIFFIDRSLGRKAISSALIETGASVVIHDDHFPQNTTDEEWLNVVGKKGWIVLSKDNRIRYRLNEISALRSAKVLAFILVAKNATGEEMAQIYLKAYKRMCMLADGEKRPSIFTVGRDGKPNKIKQIC